MLFFDSLTQKDRVESVKYKFKTVLLVQYLKFQVGFFMEPDPDFWPFWIRTREKVYHLDPKHCKKGLKNCINEAIYFVM